MLKYGWKRDLPDQRDFKFTAPTIELPPKVDLSKGIPMVFNQGSLGSCTANALGMAFLHEQLKQDSDNPFVPSRLFIYYNERLIEGSVATDSGAMLRDGIKTMVRFGTCSEQDWPYDIKKFARRPKIACYRSALSHQIIKYLSISQSLNEMKSCLALGFPFSLGIGIYNSFETEEVAMTGIVPMPASTETLLGGHAILCVGYDDETQRFLMLNSWGKDWGMDGYFTIPYNYLTNPNLASDFWTIRLVEV